MIGIDPFDLELLEKEIRISSLINDHENTEKLTAEMLWKFDSVLDKAIYCENYQTIPQNVKNVIIAINDNNQLSSLQQYFPLNYISNKFYQIDPHDPDIWYLHSKFNEKNYPATSYFALLTADKFAHNSTYYTQEKINHDFQISKLKKYFYKVVNVDVINPEKSELLSILNNKFSNIPTTAPNDEFVRLHNMIFLIELNSIAEKFEFYNNNYENALQIYEQMIDTDRFSQDGWAGKLRIIIKQNNHNDLVKSLEELKKIYKEIASLTCKADDYTCVIQNTQEQYFNQLKYVEKISNERDYDAGKLTSYKEILQLDPVNIDAAIKLGILHEKDGLNSLAIQYYEKALQFSNDEYTKEQLNLKIKQLTGKN